MEGMMKMSSNGLGTEIIGGSLRGIFAELFGGPRSWIIRDAIPLDGSAQAVLGCALEALRYYLAASAQAPSRADVGWFHTRVDEIIAERMRRKS
jgi:hypothetical protein